jgi:hypothetical protein
LGWSFVAAYFFLLRLSFRTVGSVLWLVFSRLLLVHRSVSYTSGRCVYSRDRLTLSSLPFKFLLYVPKKFMSDLADEYCIATLLVIMATHSLP